MVVIIIELGNIGSKIGLCRKMEMMKFSLGYFEFEEFGGVFK